MSLTHSTVDLDTAHSWRGHKPCLSDITRSNGALPAGGQVVYHNKIYPSATMALEAYIDEYFGLSKSKYYQHGRDCVAELLLMAPGEGTTVTALTTLDAQSRCVDGDGGRVVTESFAKANDASNEKPPHSGRNKVHLKSLHTHNERVVNTC